MKIKKNGSVIDITESEIKKIITKYKINKFLNESLLNDTAKETKNNKMDSIIKNLRSLSNTLDTTSANIKASSIDKFFGQIENKILEKLEDVEELIKKQREKEKK